MGALLGYCSLERVELGRPIREKRAFFSAWPRVWRGFQVSVLGGPVEWSRPNGAQVSAV